MARRKVAETFGTVDDGQMLLGNEDVELIERGERRLAHVLSAETRLKVVSLVEDDINTLGVGITQISPAYNLMAAAEYEL